MSTNRFDVLRPQKRILTRATVALFFAALSLSQLGCKKKESATIDTSSTTTNGDSPTSDVTGSYKITSATSPGGGGAYTGTAMIDKRQDVLRMHWTIDGSQAFHGVALQTGNILGVGWGRGKAYGVVIYTVNGGTLKGAWAAHDSTKIGVENLAGPAGLNGDYTITEATFPGTNTSYGGHVQIKPTGSTYSVTWKLTSGESYNGVAIKDGDKLIVGWGSTGSEAGVVDYKVNGTNLDGTWAIPNGTALGTEKLARR